MYSQLEIALDPRIKVVIDVLRTIIATENISSTTVSRLQHLINLTLHLEEMNKFPRYTVSVG
jgi:hypothetical protein